MARPQKRTVDYFPHHCSHGKTMFIIEQKFGNDGYAFWFKLLEMLGRNDGHVIDVRNEAEWEYLISVTRVDDQTCEDILNLLAKLQAIDPELWENRIIWCQNFVDGIKDAYRYRTSETPIRPSIPYKKPTSTGVSDIRNPETKVKETKVKDTSSPPIVPPPPPPEKPKNGESRKSPISSIVEIFNNNIHPITPIESEKVLAWLDDGMSPDVVIYAINEAVLNATRNMSYIEAILRNLHAEGITTIEGVNARTRRRKKAPKKEEVKKDDKYAEFYT